MKLLSLCLMVLVLACGQSDSSVEDISRDELLAISPGAVLILDVRTPEEYRSGHVPRSINVPLDQVEAKADGLGSSYDVPVVVYCERGGRANKAATLLRSSGYTDVRHLAGDMSGWRGSGLPAVKE